jgi:hypothetical protein
MKYVVRWPLLPGWSCCEQARTEDKSWEKSVVVEIFRNVRLGSDDF